MGQPLVSVCMITYNHEKYISKAIEGVLMQKTNFKFELVIGEDCSTDRTASVIKKYQKNYPDIIVARFNKENMGMMPNSFKTLAECRGEFVALCEGDDFWIDENKLQIQVDLLKRENTCSCVFHSAECQNDKLEKIAIRRPLIDENKTHAYFGIKDIIRNGGGFITTNSLLFKSYILKDMPNWMYDAPVGDLPLSLLLSLEGRILYIDKVMSVYRVMSTSSWSKSMKDTKKLKAHHDSIIRLWMHFDRYTKKKYHNQITLKLIKNSIFFYLSLFKRLFN